ncbi:MAG: TetR/AcrR family transcriptional regulator [Parvibaculum sp.]|uniref:TetR/AcrR family transcriptional regulator n=1 Tax=Parvibaculum sp. TaxID=2024848 RepID=UPI0025E9E5B2|nr:TetR/AcrR family transcriptional regulator [Parvibaculum sp.]MCE9650479.1 TetR/AcrR family transcriptional regulator [Parvibaculum sp.]
MAKKSPSPWQRKTEASIAAREEKRMAVLKAGAEEFRDKGFHNVSLDDIARKLGVTKPTLYYYISDKQDIVYASGMAAMEELKAVIQADDRKKSSGLHSLTTFFREYVGIIAGDFGYCLVMLDENLMGEDRAREFRHGKHELNDAVRKMLERGVRDGSIRSGDMELTSFALFGAFNWVAKWHKSSSPSIDYIADVFTSVFLKGIGTASAQAQPNGGTTKIRGKISAKAVR